MRWRLLLDPPREASYNMAVDEVLYLSARRTAVATLRLYSFSRPTVSLGHRQRIELAVDETACRANGVDLVRRITGGWALLHQHELTWSVTAPTREGTFRGASVRDSYTMVNTALRESCGGLGVRLDPESSRNRVPDDGRDPDPALPCLAVRSAHEITVGGRKLVPSAQRRHRDSLLQHGSILFTIDEDLWRRIRPAHSVASLSAVGLDELLAAPPAFDSVIASLRSAFGRLFGDDGILSALDEWEQSELGRIEAKYASRDFTARRGWNRLY